MGMQITMGGGNTRIKYCGYGKEVVWYIKEPKFSGVVKCDENGLVLNLPDRPNLLERFPEGAFLERTSEGLKPIADRKTIDDMVARFQ